MLGVLPALSLRAFKAEFATGAGYRVKGHVLRALLGSPGVFVEVSCSSAFCVVLLTMHRWDIAGLRFRVSRFGNYSFARSGELNLKGLQPSVPTGN